VTKRDYYKLLQVDPEADAGVITAAYEVLAAKLQPQNDLTGVDEIRLQELQRAYAVLSHEGRRRAYDIERSMEYVPLGPGERIGVPAGQPPVSVLAEGVAEPASVAQQAGLEARGLSGRLSTMESFAPAGSTVLDFGRFAGRTLREIAAEDADYLRWLTRHSSGIRFRNEIETLLRDLGEHPW
jgi:curved DNA-binding protein CbpA